MIWDVDPSISAHNWTILLAETKVDNNHRYKGLNLLFRGGCLSVSALASRQFAISGFANKNLRQHLPRKNSGQMHSSAQTLASAWHHREGRQTIQLLSH